VMMGNVCKVHAGGGCQQHVDIDGSRATWRCLHQHTSPRARFALRLCRSVTVVLSFDRPPHRTAERTSQRPNAPWVDYIYQVHYVNKYTFVQSFWRLANLYIFGIIRS